MLASDPSPGNGVSVPLGTRLTMSGAAGKVTLTVVGIADSVDSSAGGWVLPSEIAKLRAPGTPPAAQMQYRFRDAGTAAAVRADVAAVTAALPAGAVTGTESYLAIKAQESSNIAPFVPFVVAFAVLGLALSALIVANVVSGAVVAGYRRIGVLKSIGFSPGQVVAAYTGQAMVPAIAGLPGRRGAGEPARRAGARPDRERVRRRRAARADVGGRGRAAGHVLPDRDLRAAAGAAGRPVQRGAGDRRRARAPHRPRLRRAPAAGQAGAAPAGDDRARGPVRPPGPHRDHADRRAARRHRGDVRGRPGRVAEPGRERRSTTRAPNRCRCSCRRAAPAAAASSCSRRPCQGDQARRAGRRAARPGKPPTPAEAERAITAALRAQPGTLRYVAQTDQQLLSVAGLSQQVAVTAFQGDATWTGYAMISGHWYTGPGQAVVGTGFLTDTGKSVGDTVTIVSGSRQVPVKIVGRGLRHREQRPRHDHRLADAGPGRARG